MAQQQPNDDVKIVVPLPDLSDLPPLTPENFDSREPPAPADAAKDTSPKKEDTAQQKAEEPVKAEAKPEPNQDAATPAAEPASPSRAKPRPRRSPRPFPPPPTARSPISCATLIGGKQFDRLVSRKADREGAEHFYKARDYKPLWVADGAATEHAKAALAYLAQVDTDGLDPTDYPTPDFKSAVTAATLAEDELKLTEAVLKYARQAQIGRIHFSRVGADIQFTLVAPEPAEVLAKLAKADDTGKALDSYNPPQPEFAALKAKLAELRKGALTPKAEEEKKPVLVHVPEGKILREGMKDPRVIALRKRLNIPGDKYEPAL